MEEEAKHGPGLPHLPGSSMGEHDKSRDKDMLTVNIIRDENTGVCKILVRGDVYTRNDLLAWMYPRARIKINPKTKLSEVPVLIRCDRDAPFRMVQKVLAICAHKDIQICKVMLAVAED